MPPLRLWFIGLRAVIVAMGGVLIAQLTQLSGTQTSIAFSTWMVALVTGVMAGANAMHVAWPENPPARSVGE